MKTSFFIMEMTKRIGVSLIILLSPVSLMAESFEVDGMSFTITSTYTVSVSQGNNYAGHVIIPEYVTYAGKRYRVSSIGEGAFDKCKDLTSVTIPGTVRSIERHAFYMCTGLTSMEIPSGVLSVGEYVFAYSGLKSLVIEEADQSYDGLESIGSGAFSNCKELVSAVLPKSLKTMGSRLFYECAALTSVDMGNATSIEEETFYNCTALESVTIPRSVATVKPMAFKNCSSLKTLTI